YVQNGDEIADRRRDHDRIPYEHVQPGAERPGDGYRSRTFSSVAVRRRQYLEPVLLADERGPQDVVDAPVQDDHGRGAGGLAIDLAADTVCSMCSASASASRTLDAPNACSPRRSRCDERPARTAPSTRDSPSIPNFPAPSSPTSRTRSSRVAGPTAARSRI